MSLYSDYLKEREGVNTLETEGGFATYKFRDIDCYIVDIYVVPEKRKEHLASRMADQVATIAKEKGYRLLTGSVDSRVPSASASEAVLRAYGMKPYRTEGFMMYFVKELN